MSTFSELNVDGCFFLGMLAHMKNKRPLTIQQHAELGTAIKQLMSALVLVSHSQGKSSRGSYLAGKIYKDLTSLQSDMEDAGYRDGFTHIATDFYYDLSPHHGVDSIEELVEKYK